jgi:hypothetical protein
VDFVVCCNAKLVIACERLWFLLQRLP